MTASSIVAPMNLAQATSSGFGSLLASFPVVIVVVEASLAVFVASISGDNGGRKDESSFASTKSAHSSHNTSELPRLTEVGGSGMKSESSGFWWYWQGWQSKYHNQSEPVDHIGCYEELEQSITCVLAGIGAGTAGEDVFHG